ncbi:uncharacterized protein LOC130802383 isoform X5 [Amaranthus tricolor]|uniref:uncharacterized protein LOC130802383 isoform X5 n=1 Tax=Amaranthus tricolor TaxID=29722 RepID=UPI00258F4A53|nr:uncharacterized protein LOC130802383 isoform X5 [Amaranthus tricolor]
MNETMASQPQADSPEFLLNHFQDINKELDNIQLQREGKREEESKLQKDVDENGSCNIQSIGESDYSNASLGDNNIIPIKLNGGNEVIFDDVRECGMIQGSSIESEHKDDKIEKDTHNEKRKHNTYFEHQEKEEDHHLSIQFQATNSESDNIQLQREVKRDEETILEDRSEFDEDHKEEVDNESLKNHDFCSEYTNKEIGEAPATTSDFQHQEQIEVHVSLNKFKEVDIFEEHISGIAIVDDVNQDLNEEVNIIQGKNDDEASEKMSSIEVKEIEATTIQTTQERYCSTIFVEQSKCDVPHAEEHKDNENEKDTYIEKEEHNTCFEHEDQKEDDDPSNQDLNEKINIIQGKYDDEASTQMSSIDVKEIEATTIQTTRESDYSTIFFEQSKCDVPHAKEHKDNENEKDTYIEKEEHNSRFEHEDLEEVHDSSNKHQEKIEVDMISNEFKEADIIEVRISETTTVDCVNQVINIESDIIQLQWEVKIEDETIFKDSFKVDEDDKEEVANVSLKNDGFCGGNINKEMGEAPTIASDFKHQEKTDLHLSSIEFNEVHIVQENNSGTATVDGMIQDLNEEVNIIQGKNKDEACEQINSIEVKENEATAIQTNQESDFSTIFIEQSKCEEPHIEEHNDNENVDDTYTEKEEHNTCFKHEDQEKEHDSLNQATNIKSDFIKLQREVKIDDETIIKDNFKVDIDDNEEGANESLTKDGFFGENINKEIGEAPTIASDFQHQEKIDIHVSSIEFKEVDIVEANNSGTATVDGVNQDLNEEVNIIQGKNVDEACEKMSSIVVKEKEATTNRTNQESDCSTIFVEQRKCDEPHVKEYKDNEKVDDTYTKKEEHNTCFDHEDLENEHDTSNQATSIESYIIQIQREVNIDNETIIKDSFKIDEDDKEEVTNKSLKTDGFSGENINKQMGEAPTTAADFQHQEKIDLHVSSIEFKEVDIVEANNSGTATVDSVNQDLNDEVNIIQGKNEDEAFEQMSSIEVKENEATTIQTNKESDCSTIIVEQSKCDEFHVEEHNDNENVDDTYTEKEEHSTCFEHEDKEKVHYPSNQATSIESDIIQLQREVKIDNETIIKDSFKIDEDDKEEVINESLKTDGFCGENIKKQMGEALTTTANFQHQEKIDVHVSLIEFKEVDFIEANNSGTNTVDSVNQDLNDEVNIIQGKNEDEAFEQMSSIEVKENEATTIQTNKESDCSTIIVEQSKCDEFQVEEHNENENVDDTYTEKEEHNTCFEHDNKEKDHDPSNQATYIESDIIQLQREVKIDKETIIKYSFNIDEDDKEEVTNESLKMDCFCGENINKQMGEALTTAADFQHQEKLDLHVSSIEFKEVDFVEANNSGTTTVDSVNQDLNDEVNIIQGKNEDEAFDQMSSIEVKENEATTIQTNKESDCSMIIVEQSKCDEFHVEEHNDNENVDDTYTEKEEHNTCFEHEDKEKDHDPSNQATNIESDIIRLQREVKIDDETIIKDSFKMDEDDKEEVANESLKAYGFFGENINKQMGEAPTTTADFHHQEKIDLHVSSIEFKEVDIVEANNSGTATVDSVNQDLNDEVNIIQGKNEDEAFEQMTSNEVKENEATTIETNQESDCITIIVEQSNFDEPHVEEHIDNENVEDTYTEKEKHNTCFEHEDQEKEHVPSNQASNIKSDFIKLQREVKIDHETIIKDSFKVDEDDNEEVANESLKKDGFCGEDRNKEIGEAPTIAFDFQHQEKIDLHMSSIEFKEVYIVEANNSGTATIDGVNQDLNEEINISQEKKDDEAFKEISSIEVKENEATTIQSNKKSYCSTFVVEESKCDERHVEEHNANENVDDTYTEKESFEHEDQATSIESDIIQLQREVKIDDETIIKDSLKIDEDEKEEVTNESLKRDDFCGENKNKQMGEAPTTAADFQHQEKIDLYVSSIEFNEVDFVEANTSRTATIDCVNQDLNDEINIIQGKNEDEAFEQMSFIEVKENEATTIQTNKESDCSTIIDEQSKCDEPHVEEHNDNENADDTYTEKEEHNTCFEHEDKEKDHDPSNQDLNDEVNIIQGKNEDEAFEQMSSIEVKENEATTIETNQESDCITIFDEESNFDEPHVEEHNDNENVEDTYTEIEEHNTCFEQEVQKKEHVTSNQASNIKSDFIKLQREVKIDDETIIKDSYKVGEAPTIAFDFQHQEKIDLHMSSIEFKEVYIVEANNSGTATIDGVNQDLNEEVNISQGKKDDEVFNQMSSIEVKENEAITIQTNKESYCSTIVVEQSKCDEPHVEEHHDNENVDDTYLEKEEHNMCFEYEDREKDHDPPNQATSIESEIIQLQREVKIDDETIIKDSLKIDEDEKEEVTNESLKTDGFCGENINKQIGEAPTTAADFQHQEKIDLHVSSIEFKEVDVVEANNSGTTTVDSVNQDLNDEVNIIQGKNEDEAFEQMISIEVKENEATMIKTNQESDCITIFVEQSNCDEPDVEEHKDNENVDDTYTEKEEHNTCFEHQDQEKEHDPSNQDLKEEVNISQGKKDDEAFKEMCSIALKENEATTIQTKKETDCSTIIVEQSKCDEPHVKEHNDNENVDDAYIEKEEHNTCFEHKDQEKDHDPSNQAINIVSDIIHIQREVKIDDETIIKDSFKIAEDDKEVVANESLKTDGFCGENINKQVGEAPTTAADFQHQKKIDLHVSSIEFKEVDIVEANNSATTTVDSVKQDLNDEVNIIQGKNEDEAFEQMSSIEVKETEATTIKTNQESDCVTIFVEQSNCNEPDVEEHKDNENVDDTYTEKEEHNTCFEHEDQEKEHDPSNQDLKEEVNISQGKKDDEAFKEMCSIEVKENEATTIQTKKESDCSTIIVEQSKCDEPHVKQHNDNENVDDAYMEKEEHNTCFEHEDKEKDHDPSNQAINIVSDIIHLQREVKIDDETIIKDSFKIAEDDKEVVANESLKTDGFCGENINKQVGEAPTTAADFQYQEKIDLHVSSIEFKEVDIVEANNSETTTVDSVKQDLNDEVNIIQGKNEDEAFEQMSSIEVKENDATTIKTNQESDCITIFVEQSNCDEPDVEEHKDNENVDDTYTEKEEHNTCFEHEDQEKEHDPSNQDLKEEVNISQGKTDDEAFKEMCSIEVKENEATTIQTKKESDCSTIIVEQSKCDEPHVKEHNDNENVDDAYMEKEEHNTCFEHEDQEKDHDPSNQAINIVSDIIHLQREVKIDDETIIKDSFKIVEDDKEVVANESLKIDGFCGENINKQVGEAPTTAADFQHQEKIDLHVSSIEFKEVDIVEANNSETTTVDSVNQDLNDEVNIIQGKNEDEACEQMSSIEVKENEATTIQTNQESDSSTIFVEQSKCDVPLVEEHKDNENVDDTYMEKEEHNTCFEHEDQEEDHDPSNQASYTESNIIQLKRELKLVDETISKDSSKVDEDDKEEDANESLKKHRFCCENTNKETGEAPKRVSDFQHRQQIEVHVSSNEFKEADIVEENVSAIATVDSVNQIIITDNKQDISKAKEVKDATKDNQVIEPKASDEEETETSNQRDFDSGMTVGAIDDLKTTHKKSLNILSGVGSKVKHSISKVKKAMTCTSAPFASEDVIIKLNKNKK